MRRGPRELDRLYDAVRRCWSFHTLKREAFDRVIAMLCGRYADTRVRDDYVTVDGPPPTAAFSGMPTTGAAPLAVDFTDESTGAVTVDVSLDAPSGLEVTVPFALAGTATLPDDATVSGSPLVIPAGQTTATATITVVDDLLDELAETVVLDTTSSDGEYAGIADYVVGVTVNDDDVAGVVTSGTVVLD